MINNKYKLMPGTKTIEGKKVLLLCHHRMPGDIISMTPLVRDLKKTYGDQIEIKCGTPQGQEVWENNPYVIDKGIVSYDERYDLDYNLAAENEARGLHISEAFRQDFMAKSGYHLIASDMWPDIFLKGPEVVDLIEKDPFFSLDVKQSFWVICPGNKSSIQTKIWPHRQWIEFVKANSDYTFIQIGQSKHGHKPIEARNVINYVDQTTLRELFVLIYLSQGTIGYASLHMHVAAAFKKPSIVLAGGRESPSFFKYPNHIVHSTIGWFDCCRYKGCWQGKCKTVREICGKNCFREGGEYIPACMNIDVDATVDIFRDLNKHLNKSEK